MTMPGAAQAPEGARGAPGPWAAAVLVAWLAISAWPIVGGMVAANDDLKFVRSEQVELGLPSAIAHAWRHLPTFRPLELALGSMCDPASLAVGLAVPAVQALGLLALVLGTVALARRAAPAFPAAGPLAALLVLLSPATTAAAWQVDAASQTWSGALGAWAMVLAWDACVRGREGHGVASRAVLLAATFAVGCTIKESFYGWSASIGGAMLACAAWRAARRLPGAAAAAWLAIPTVALPALHLGLRLATGAIGSAAEADPGARYSAELGMNLLVNVGMAVGGSVATGPFHAVPDDGAPVLLRAAPVLAALAALGAVIVALGFGALHRATGGLSRLAPSLLAAIVSVGSLVVVLPMGSVSELYCLGANVGTAVLVAASLCALWSPLAQDERTLCRAVAVPCAAAMLAIGALGLAGRAYHHRITWEYAKLCNEAILSKARSAEPVDPASGRAACVVYLAGPCILGRTYGQYVIPPAQSIGIEETGPWLRRRDPSRPVGFTVSVPSGDPRPQDLVLDCASMPARARW